MGLRIAFIGLKGLPPRHGGMETMTEVLALALAAKGHQVSVYGLRSGLPRPENYPSNLKLVEFAIPRLPYIRSFLLVLLGLVHCAFRPVDIVHINGIEYSVLSWIPRLFGKKVVVNVRGLSWTITRWGSFWGRFIKNSVIALAQVFFRLNLIVGLRFPHLIIAVSDFIKERVGRAVPKRVEVVYNILPFPALNGDDTSRKSLSLDPKRYIMFVGRLVPLKGCHILIEAYKKARLDCPLIIVGDHTRNDSYVRFVKTMAQKDLRIRLVGGRYGADLYSLLRDARFVVLPSETEGMAVTILECAVLKTPILVSGIPQNTSLWKDSVTYFRPRDAEDLTRRLEYLANSANLNDLAEQAHRFAITEFDPQKQIERLESIYLSIAR